MLANRLPPFFLTQVVSQCHLWDVMSYVWSLVFLFTGSFVSVLFCSTSIMVPNILQGKQPSYLSFLWGSCYIVFSQVAFLFSRDTLFKFFLSSPLIWWCQLLIFASHFTFSFLRAFWCFSWFRSSIPSVVCFPFFIISSQIPSLYPDCIFSLSVLEFQVLLNWYHITVCKQMTMNK